MTTERRRPLRFQPLLAATGLLVIPAQVHALVQSADAPTVRWDYPLNCRGGERLVFDTLGAHADTASTVKLSLTFSANPIAAGPEGQGLQPGTCAWVDRPLTAGEPKLLHSSIGATDSAPLATVGDSGMYWGFLAHASDSGYLTAVGYRHWHASPPPLPHSASASGAVPTSRKGAWLPFNPRHLPWYLAGWMVFAWASFLPLTALWSGWRRLVRLYPYTGTAQGDSFRASPMVMGLANYRGGVRLTTDASHLHFSMGPLLRPSHPAFSVPWSDVRAARDTWPWLPFKGDPVIRLSLARHSGLRILLPVKAGERVVAASEGRLQLSGPILPAPTPTDASTPLAAERPISSRR